MNDGMSLRELREQSGKTRAEVAAALGVSISGFSNYENGNRKIGIEQVLVLAKKYGETAEEIIHAQLNSCRTARSDSRT